VEETVVTDGGRPRRVDVPVEMPHGMSYDGVFGRESRVQSAPSPMAAMRGSAGGFLPRQKMAMATAEPMSQTNVIEQPSRKIDPSLLNGTSGKVRVKIWLNDASQETMALLKVAGVEIVTTQQSGKLVIAAIDAGKLLDLAKLASVRYVAPLR
jgi:Ca-activated chloride channel homolog